MEQRYGTEVWNRGMERILQTGMERRYGTGVWNGCGPGPCSGPCILTCTHMKRLWNHVRNFCHVSTTSLVIPSECGTLIYPIAKIQGLSVDPQPRKLWPGLPGSLPGFGKQKHHEATGSGKKKQLIPVEQSRKVWIPQLLRTSKSSTQEVYFYHLLSVFHVKDSSD